MPNMHVSFDERIMTIAPEGVLSANDIVQAINEYYPSLDGRSVLWDLMHADISSFTKEDFVCITSTVRKARPPGGSRKTAYAVANRSTYLIICKYLNEAASLRLPVEYAAFTNFDAAKQWLEKK